jgi:DNA-binding response OmpR family regulator
MAAVENLHTMDRELAASAEDWDVQDEGWVSPPPAERQVLIVDDDPALRSLLAFVFEDEGFAVLEAEDGAEAIDALRIHRPTCMLLDLMLPTIDGMGVLKTCRDEGLIENTRVVVLTGRTDPADAAWCWELGVDSYVTKPVDPDALLRDVLVLLKQSLAEIATKRGERLAEAHRLAALEAAVGLSRSR